MSKKADLSLSVIVMAVVALLVLVVLGYIFLGSSGNFSEGIGACNANEYCAERADECKGLGYDLARPSNCNADNGGDGKYCCQNVG